MKGSERIRHVDSNTPRMKKALPGLPMSATVMVRLLRISVFGLSNVFDPLFRSLDLSENSFHVLCLLVASETGSASPSELSEMVGTSRARMTAILDELVEDGYVTRAVASRDGRRHVISLAAAGRRKVRETVPRVAEPLRVAFSQLSEPEMRQLDQLLRKAIGSFDRSGHALRSAA